MWCGLVMVKVGGNWVRVPLWLFRPSRYVLKGTGRCSRLWGRRLWVQIPPAYGGRSWIQVPPRCGEIEYRREPCKSEQFFAEIESGRSVSPENANPSSIFLGWTLLLCPLSFVMFVFIHIFVSEWLACTSPSVSSDYVEFC